MSSTNPNDILSAYHDREATADEQSAAKALVEGSPEASREVKDYQRLSRLIQELPRLAAPSEFAAAVMQRGGTRKPDTPRSGDAPGVRGDRLEKVARSASTLVTGWRSRGFSGCSLVDRGQYLWSSQNAGSS